MYAKPNANNIPATGGLATVIVKSVQLGGVKWGRVKKKKNQLIAFVYIYRTAKNEKKKKNA